MTFSKPAPVFGIMVWNMPQKTWRSVLRLGMQKYYGAQNTWTGVRA